MGKTTLVTGGSGYIGALLVQRAARGRPRGARARLAAARPGGHRRRAGAGRRRGDPRRHPRRRRPRARADRRRGRRAPRRDRRRPGVRARPEGLRRGQRPGHRARSSPTPASPACERLVFASTCSNYGRMADPTVPITEEGELRPVSLYAEQKVGMEKLILGGGARHDQADLPALRDRLRRRAADALRPDRQRVHARTVGRPRAGSVRRAVLAPLHPRARRRPRGAHGARGARARRSPARSSTPGARARTTASSTSSRRSASRSTAASVSYVHRDEDPRDYKVSFDKIRAELGFETLMTVPDGIAEIIAGARREAVRRPVRPPLQEHPLSAAAPAVTHAQMAAPRPSPSCRCSTCGWSRRTCEAVAETLRSGWLTLGPAHGGLRGGLRRAPRRPPRDRRLQLHRRAAPRLPGRRRRPGRRGDRAVVHVRRDRRRGALLRRHAGVRGDRLARAPEPRPRATSSGASRRARRRCASSTTPATPPPRTA